MSRVGEASSRSTSGLSPLRSKPALSPRTAESPALSNLPPDGGTTPTSKGPKTKLGNLLKKSRPQPGGKRYTEAETTNPRDVQLSDPPTVQGDKAADAFAALVEESGLAKKETSQPRKVGTPKAGNHYRFDSYDTTHGDREREHLNDNLKSRNEEVVDQTTVDFMERSDARATEASIQQALQTSFLKSLELKLPDSSSLARYPLLLAAHEGDVITFGMLLRAEKSRDLANLVMCPDSMGRTVLHLAAQAASAEICRQV